MLRAFTHFNQNLKITKIYIYFFVLRKKKRTRAYPSSKKDGYVYGDAFCVPWLKQMYRLVYIYIYSKDRIYQENNKQKIKRENNKIKSGRKERKRER